MAASTEKEEEEEAAIIRRTLLRWKNVDCEDNTTQKGVVAAGLVCREFLDWWRPTGNRTEPDIYAWLQSVCQRPEWRRCRLNRALPQRVVVCLLTELGYTRVSNIHVTYDRRMSRIDLIGWWQDLRQTVPGRAADPEDPQWLWNVCEAEWLRVDAYTRRARQEKLRRWNRYLLGGANAPCRLGATHPPVPDTFLSDRFGMVDPYIRFFAIVRWSDHVRVLELFRTLVLYAANVSDRRHARSIASYVRPFFHLCVALYGEERAPGGALVPLLDTTTRADCAAALARVVRGRGRSLKAAFQFTGGVWSGLLPTWVGWPPLTRREVGYHPVRRQRQRDRFTDAELEAMRAVAAEDPLDHGLLTFVLHTGCRSGAVCSLRVDDVCDVTTDPPTMRAVGSVEEKGGQRREFAIDTVLAAALRACERRGDSCCLLSPRCRHREEPGQFVRVSPAPGGGTAPGTCQRHVVAASVRARQRAWGARAHARAATHRHLHPAGCGQLPARREPVDRPSLHRDDQPLLGTQSGEPVAVHAPAVDGGRRHRPRSPGRGCPVAVRRAGAGRWW